MKISIPVMYDKFCRCGISSACMTVLYIDAPLMSLNTLTLLISRLNNKDVCSLLVLIKTVLWLVDHQVTK